MKSAARDAVLVVNDGSVAGTPVVYAGPNLRNLPNPFNPSTQIHYELSHEGRTVVRIYDVGGRLVRVLGGDVLPSGANSLASNGTDDHGVGVVSGTYLYRLYLDGSAVGEARRMTLLK